ncbi:MAG: hypothetical protein NTV86_23755 [Planctomycetota bacterium]|nr:hypothetical protein [Planctomycetota bacterium]
MTTEASIGTGAVVSTTGDIDMTARADLGVQNIAGAGGIGKSAGIGVAIAVNVFTVNTNAFIGDATVDASGTITLSATSSLSPLTLVLPALPDPVVTSIAVGGGVTTGDAGVGGSAIVDVLTFHTHAYIAGGANVNDTAVAGADQSISLSATNNIHLNKGAGGLGVAIGTAGVGIGLDVTVLTLDTDAYIAPTAVVHTADDVTLTATSIENILTVAATGSAGGTAAVSGSLVICVPIITTRARIGYVDRDTSTSQGATVHATGNVSLTASNDETYELNSGGLAFGGTAGIGIAAVGLGGTETVEAYVGAGSSIEAKGDTGLSLTANNTQDIQVISVAGSGGGTAGVAGSINANVLIHHTHAFIDGGTITATSPGATNPGVALTATDTTKLLGLAGSVTFGGTAGVGAGLDVGVITKDTQAFIAMGTTVTADGNVVVTANSVEDVTSVSAAGSGGGTAGIAGTVGVYVVTNHTTAYIGHDPDDTGHAAVDTNVTADGNVIVAADDQTDLNVISGNVTASGTASVGAAVGVPIVTKTTKAFLGNKAKVTAKGVKTAYVARTGSYAAATQDVQFKGSTAVAGNVIDLGYAHGFTTGQAVVYYNGGDSNISGLTDGTVYYAIVTGAHTIKLATTKANAEAGTFITINGAGETKTTHRITAADTVSLPSIGDADLSAMGLAAQRTVNWDTKSVRGVAVTATNRDRVAVAGVSGGASGTVSVNIGGVVDVTTNHTYAFIADGAEVNNAAGNAGAHTDQSVLVGAGSDSYYLGIAGGLGASGSVAVTPSAAVLVFTGDTKAYIDDNTIVNAKGDVLVTARTGMEAVSVSAGVALSGEVSVAGSLGVIVLNDTTLAYIGNDATSLATGAHVDADGNVLVSATDNTDITAVVGSLGIGFGAVGVGAAVGVTSITKNTRGYVGDYATVNARGVGGTLSGILTSADPNADKNSAAFTTTSTFHGLAVQANSREELLTIAAAGAGGFYAGVAGGVSVEIIKSDTTATIGQYADINKGQVPGDADAAQGINLSAGNDTIVAAIGGALGIGIAGIGGGVDVGVVRNNTKAYVKGHAELTARGDVDVNSLSRKNVDTKALSVGGGVVGAAGSVSVWTIGTTVSGNYDDHGGNSANAMSTSGADYSNVQSFADAQAGGGDSSNGYQSMLAGYSGSGDTSVQRSGTYTAQAGSDIQSAAPSNLAAAAVADTTAPDGTVAYVDGSASIDAGGNVGIVAKENVGFTGLAGSAAGGGVAIGASILVASIKSNTNAYVVTGASIAAGNDVTVEAGMTGAAAGNAYAGTVGAVALGAQVVVITDTSTQAAHIDNGANITDAGGTVSVYAHSVRNDSALAIGGSIASVAAGVAVGVVTVGGSTVASMGSANIGQTGTVNNVSVIADSDVTADSQSYGVIAGLGGLAANGVVSVADVSPTVRASIANGAHLTATGDLDVQAASHADADTYALGVAVSGFGATLGISVADTQLHPTVQAYIGTGGGSAVIHADGDVGVRGLINYTYNPGTGAYTRQTTKGATAEAISGSGSLIAALSGSSAISNDTSSVTASIGAGSTIHAGGDMNLVAKSSRDSNAQAWGIAIAGLVGAGAAGAAATVGGSTQAHMEGIVTTAVNVNVVADAYDHADAQTTAGAVGLAAGQVNAAITGITSAVESRIGSSASVTASGNVSVAGASQTVSSADAIGLSGGYAAIGASIATASSTPTISTYVGTGATVNAGGNLSVTGRHNTQDGGAIIDQGSTATAEAASGGVFAGAGTMATATNSPVLNTYIAAGGSHIIVAGDISVDSRAYNKADGTGNGLVLGVLGFGAVAATATAAGTNNAYVEASHLDGGSLAVNALTKDNVDAETTSGAGGIVAGSGSVAMATADSDTSSHVSSSDLAVDGALSVQATAQPVASADAFGVNAGALSVGVSMAVATTSPTVTAYAGGTLTAQSLSVSAAQNLPASGYMAHANAIGGVGGLLVGVSATASTAQTTGVVTGYVAADSTLVIADSIAVTAFGNSIQRADTDSATVGAIAVGGNGSTATSNVQTRAYLGSNVNVGAGSAVGGLTDGTLYYVIVDKLRPFTPSSAISGNLVNLGAGHGLQDGDEVTYIKGVGTNTAVGGLTSGTVYAVELDPSDPTKITLHDHITNALITLNGSLATGTGHRFVIVNPRLVKLATSFDNATASVPVAADLSNPSTYGSSQSLAPYLLATTPTGFTPRTDLDAAHDTIEVGPGSGLYSGQAVIYHKGTGPSLSIHASGNDSDLGTSVAGSGGLIAGAAAAVTTSSTSGTYAYIADDAAPGDSTHTNLEVSALSVLADHTANVDGTSDSVQASLVGFSGSAVSNTSNATVEATVGVDAHVTTQNVDVEATSNALKTLVAGDADNVTGGSGGVLAGTAATSVTQFTNHTHATIGGGANIALTGSVYTPGQFTVRAYNNVEGDDYVNLDAGGLISGAGATSHIQADTTDAIVTVGDDAVITSVGDVNLETRTRGVLTVGPTVHTYGLASAAAIDALARIHNNNQVVLGDSVYIQAEGALNLLAGRLADGTKNYFNVTSHGDELNASAIPIDELLSHGEIVQNHSVTVGAGSTLRSARDATLAAELDGNAEITAYGSGKNWMTAVASGVDSLLGSGGVSEELKGGTSTNTISSTVTVNGSVEVGIRKDQSLTIPKDFVNNGTAPTATDGITWTSSTESIATNLINAWNHYKDLLEEYAGDPVSEAAYQTQITQLELQMTALGLKNDNGTPGDTSDDTYMASFASPFITVNDIWAQSGTIRVYGDDLLGSGELRAPADVTVTITNDSPANLRMKRITIPDTAGGRVRFNNQDIGGYPGGTGTGRADIAAINKSGATPTFTLIDSLGGSGALPQIVIHNTFNADSAENLGNLSYQDFRTPDLYLAGDIENVIGGVTISCFGSIYAQAGINAGSLSITAGNDFVLSYVDDLVNAGDEPGTHFQGVANVTEPKGSAGTYASINVDALNGGTPEQQAVYNAVNTGSSVARNIVAGNNVFISARYLNISGIVQSGMPIQAVTLDGADTGAIDAAKLAYTQWRTGLQTTAQATVAAAGLTTSDYNYFRLPAGAGDTVGAWFNVEQNRLELDTVKVRGGYMELFGRILSTGNGKLNVLDGYGQIHITNNTTYPLLTNVLDSGSGVHGLLKITDTGVLVGGKPQVTEYYRDGGIVKKRTYAFTTPGNAITYTFDGSAGGAARTASYTPAGGMRYFWQTGQNFSEKVTTTYGQSEWLGIDAFAADPDDIVDGPHRQNIDPSPLREGQFVKDDGNTNDYTYTFARINTGVSTTIKTSWSTSTWYGTTTYYVKTVVTTPQKDIHTHSVRANRDIGIEFTGFDANAAGVDVTVSSPNSTVEINGSIYNPEGQTNITAGGQIQELNVEAVVGGHGITMAAVTGVGGPNTLLTSLTDTGTGVLSATSTTGDIKISEVSGVLKVDQITTSATNGDVTLTSQGNIIGSSAGNLVRGGAITLTSAFGAIGYLGTAGKASAPGAGAQALRLFSGTTARDKVNAAATGNVYLVETGTDMQIDSIATSGDVRVEVPNGNAVDDNVIEVIDKRTETDLLALYDRMMATAASVGPSLAATTAAYEGAKTRDYQAYWTYRNGQTADNVAGLMNGQTYYVVVDGNTVRLAMTHADAVAGSPNTINVDASSVFEAEHRFYKAGSGTPITFDSVADVDSANNTIDLGAGHGLVTGDAVTYYRVVLYDASYHVTLGGAQRDAYVTYYTAQGTALGYSGTALTDYVDNAITTLENAQSQQYHTLHKTYGAIGNVDHPGSVGYDADIFDPSFSYSVSDAALHQTFGAAAVNGSNAIQIGTNVFTNGQAVMYHNGGAGTSIAGLTDGQLYYVVLVAGDPSRIQLAATQANANADPAVIISLTSGGGRRQRASFLRRRRPAPAGRLERESAQEHHGRQHPSPEDHLRHVGNGRRSQHHRRRRHDHHRQRKHRHHRRPDRHRPAAGGYAERRAETRSGRRGAAGRSLLLRRDRHDRDPARRPGRDGRPCPHHPDAGRGRGQHGRDRRDGPRERQPGLRARHAPGPGDGVGRGANQGPAQRHQRPHQSRRPGEHPGRRHHHRGLQRQHRGLRQRDRHRADGGQETHRPRQRRHLHRRARRRHGDRRSLLH